MSSVPVIIGGGPAGLTAALELTRHGVAPIVLEQGSKVGGLARTENYKGFRFDLGGHRFFTKSAEIRQLWHDILGDEFLRRPRLSRIYYRNRFFRYPLQPLDAVRGLGLWQAILITLSYLWWQVLPHHREDTFEQWVTNRFGRRLYLTFFKVYTEKVWGIPCSELRAEWAAQRIQDLSFRTVLLSMIRKGNIKSLIEDFNYPRLGPGMMWDAVKTLIGKRGGRIELDAEVVQIRRCDDRITGVVVQKAGTRSLVEGSDFISSMPVTELVRRLEPPAPLEVRNACAQLTYRDFLTVCLIVNKEHLFDDNWIYIHDPRVRVGRIQNYKNWSADMVPDPARTSLGLEYFCREGDTLWGMADAELIELAKREVEQIGLAREGDISDGVVVRVPKAYPVYDATYREALETIRRYLASFANLQTIGRNGLHRYNNQDHAMMTGLLASRNVLFGTRHDLWSVNTDQDYHEKIDTKPPPVGEAPVLTIPARALPCQASPLLSVIIPVYNGADHLRACLSSLQRSDFFDYEVLVADDASTDDSVAVAAEYGARVLRLEQHSGPAAARNHAAATARGMFLLFLDCDVVVHGDCLRRIVETLETAPDVAAVFGCYDAAPTAANLVSQFRNLLHHYVHRHGREEASTFWAGCGAIRKEAFLELGGFDTAYSRSSIEDIELGVRLHKNGQRIKLDRAIQVTHRKRWTWWNVIKTDVCDRAVPWTRLILRDNTLPNDLNLKVSQRISVVLVAALCACLIASAFTAHWLLGSLALCVLAVQAADAAQMRKASPLGGFAWGAGLLALALTACCLWQLSPVSLLLLSSVVALNHRFYAFLIRHRGFAFSVMTVPLHLSYFVCCGVGFALGVCTHRRVRSRPVYRVQQDECLRKAA